MSARPYKTTKHLGFNWVEYHVSFEIKLFRDHTNLSKTVKLKFSTSHSTFVVF